MDIPTFEEEAIKKSQGYKLIAGIDEAGRGPLAGPVVAAAIILPPEVKGKWVAMVRDSKLVTAIRREKTLRPAPQNRDFLWRRRCRFTHHRYGRNS